MSKTRKCRFTNKVYNAADFESNDGMLTTVWGPPMWHYLHTMSFNYPMKPTKREKKHYRDFLLSLQNVLPCGKCRSNLKKNFKALPLTSACMKNRYTFSRYVFELHELVNKMLKKKSGLVYEQVRERYEHFRSRCSKTKKSRNTKKAHKGCTDSLTGEKSKCILHIVPKQKNCDTFKMDKQCEKVRIQI